MAARQFDQPKTFEFNYGPDFQSILTWLREDKHLKDSRGASREPEYFTAVCRATAATIALINNQDKSPIPPGKWWQYLGQEEKSHRWRAGFSINLEELRKLSGISGLPKVDDVRPPEMRGNYRNMLVIWERNSGNPDLTKDRIGPREFVTAYSVINPDDFVESRGEHGYKWLPVAEWAAKQRTASLAEELFGRRK
jgi:hypothetical protein